MTVDPGAGGPDAPQVHLEGFDGPMDLLLDLAGRQRFDLGRVSALDLVHQFLLEMDRLAGRVSVKRRADWLVVAARLILLRSRFLLPADPAAAARVLKAVRSEDDRLEELLRMRAAADWLEARPQLGRDVFARPLSDPPRSDTLLDLLDACLLVLDGPRGPAPLPGVGRRVLTLLWKVDEAMARIRLLLATASGVDMADCLPVGVATRAPLRRRAAVASTLIASLELAKQGEITLTQEVPHGPILIGTAIPPPPDVRDGVLEAA